MSLRSLRRQLDKLRATLPPPPLPYEEMPIEEWVDEEMQDVFSETTLKNTVDEELYFKRLEELPQRLLLDIGERMQSFSNVAAFEDRVVNRLPPHIERLRELWADNFPARESRRQWIAQNERRYPKVRTRTNGYGWWFSVQEDYARLRDKYAGFEEQWAGFFEEWEEQCEGVKGNTLMDSEMREDFIRICFAREAHGTCTSFTAIAFPELLEEEDW